MLLVAMTVVTGLVHSFSFLFLGHVFVANMTGTWCSWSSRSNERPASPPGLSVRCGVAFFAEALGAAMILAGWTAHPVAIMLGIVAAAIAARVLAAGTQAWVHPR